MPPADAQATPVEAYRDERSGQRVGLWLDRESSRFFAEVAGRRIERGDLSALRQAVVDALTAAFALDWRPAIALGLAREQRADHAQAGLSVERIYYACREDGQVIRATWDVPPDQRYLSVEVIREAAQGLPAFRLPAVTAELEDLPAPALPWPEWGSEVYVAYTDEVWLVLCEWNRRLSELTLALARNLLAGQRRVPDVLARELGHLSKTYIALGQ
jgi:hypothetical protein